MFKKVIAAVVLTGLLSTTVDAGILRCLFGRGTCVRVRVRSNDCYPTDVKVHVGTPTCEPCDKPCKDCPPDPPTDGETKVDVKVTPAQAWAQREVMIMAQRGRCGHFLGCAPGASFSGVGFTSNANCPTHLIPSCKPRWRMTLIAEAVVRTSRGAYVSRHYAH